MMELVKLANIKPTIKIAIVSRNLCETAKTAIKTKKLPKLEAKTIPKDESKIEDKLIGKKAAPKTIVATPKLAPELNPKTSGPANGFLNKVCINSPLIDNPIPTRMAAMAFGNR